MDINRDNYEAWLLDQIEGRLTAEQDQQLRAFLLLNPDCAVGLDEVEPWVLEAEPVSYSGKSGLRRELPDQDSVVSEKRFDLFSIARMEGDLTDRQVDDHQRLIDGDEEKLEEWLVWKKTRLVGETILFKGKRGLKRRSAPRSRVLWISLASAAAAIMLFFVLFTVDQGETGSEELVTLDPDTTIESVVEQKAPEAKELTPQGIEGVSKKPALLASEPGILSIKKHQDPPELTGVKRDSTNRKVSEESLKPGPLRLATLEKGLMKWNTEVNRDRIEPLDLPPFYASSEKSAFQQISEKGLRQSYRDFVDENDISILTIASAGIDGINYLAGSDLSLNLSRDDEGKVSGFRYRGDLLSVDTPLKKAE